MAGSRGGPAEPDFPGPSDARPRPRRNGNGLGTAAVTLAALGLFILAFLGVVGSTGPARVLFWAAGILVATALALGILGARQVKQGYAGNRGRCLIGAVLGGLATVWCLNGAVAATNLFHHVSCQADQVQTKSASEAKPGTSPSPTTGFHTTWCFKNGVQATVSAPTPYTPRKLKDGSQSGTPGDKRTLAAQVTIRNGSTNIVNLEEFLGIGAKDANGKMADPVFDGEEHSSSVGKTLLLPGMTKVITQGFALPPSAAKSMAVEVTLNLPADRKGLWSGPEESAWWNGRVR
ncbi:hypothetical protein [Streptomyces sp. NPDC048637]|uniref:hypothetical protein n=1 Tax=Streptomyces sp. NPDC048637 TaxID=3155636 RepID=UPI00343CCF09